MKLVLKAFFIFMLVMFLMVISFGEFDDDPEPEPSTTRKSVVGRVICSVVIFHELVQKIPGNMEVLKMERKIIRLAEITRLFTSFGSSNIPQYPA